jgi:hypothetical protein
MPFDSLMFPLSLAILTHSKSSALPPCVIASRSTLVPFDIKERTKIDRGRHLRLQSFVSDCFPHLLPDLRIQSTRAQNQKYQLHTTHCFCASMCTFVRAASKILFAAIYTLLLETTICICNTLQFFWYFRTRNYLRVFLRQQAFCHRFFRIRQLRFATSWYERNWERRQLSHPFFPVAHIFSLFVPRCFTLPQN